MLAAITTLYLHVVGQAVILHRGHYVQCNQQSRRDECMGRSIPKQSRQYLPDYGWAKTAGLERMNLVQLWPRLPYRGRDGCDWAQFLSAIEERHGCYSEKFQVATVQGDLAGPISARSGSSLKLDGQLRPRRAM